jgi:hypothetical protein
LVEALCYKPEGLGFETGLILPATLGHEVYASNRMTTEAEKNVSEE